MTVLARLEHIVKDFGAVRALDNVSLDINEGQVLGLTGDNGAGKSTLVKTIAGNFQPASGASQACPPAASAGGHLLERRLVSCPLRNQRLLASLQQAIR